MSPEQNKIGIVLSVLEDALEKYGKPKELFVCDNEMLSLTEDFCRKFGIKLTKTKTLPETFQDLIPEGCVALMVLFEISCYCFDYHNTIYFYFIMSVSYTPVELSFNRYKPSLIPSQTRVTLISLNCVMCV